METTVLFMYLINIAELQQILTSDLTLYFSENVKQVIRIVFSEPYALSGDKSQPTLVKKYDPYASENYEADMLKLQQSIRKEEESQNNKNNNTQ